MSGYLKPFQDITQSIEQLLTEKHTSLEIQQSAQRLRKSVQPCLVEVKQSATKLKSLVQECFHDLNHAEDVLRSKTRVVEAAKPEIQEHLEKLSRCSNRIRFLANQCKNDTVKRANRSWDERIEFLRQKWFIDSMGNSRKQIGFSSKDGFIKQIYPKVDYQYEEMNRIIKTGLDILYQELNSVRIESIQRYIDLLDNQEKFHYNQKNNSIISEIKTKFSKPIEHLPNNILEFNTYVKPDLKILVDKGWNDIYWEEVVEFKEKVYSKIDEFITAIFDDRVKLATQAIEAAIAFYNDFLERQERYQQETPEQREAEKAWIDKRRRELMQVQEEIEAILNAN